MGKIVGAIFTTHIPRLMILEPAARLAFEGSRTSSFYDALEQVYRERIAPLAFDTFVVLDTHWWTTLEYIVNGHAHHSGIYTSDEVPTVIHDVEYDYPGDGELARKIAESAVGSGLRTIASTHRGLPLHYGTVNPMHYLNARKDKRVLPVSVLYTSSLENDLAFGGALRRAIDASERRVLLVASGGLSHHFWSFDELGAHTGSGPEHIFSAKNLELDLQILELMKSGRHAEILALAEEFRASCSPEGRFAHYLMMAGALGRDQFSTPGFQYGRYENAIGTGQAIVWFDV